MHLHDNYINYKLIEFIIILPHSSIYRAFSYTSDNVYGHYYTV